MPVPVLTAFSSMKLTTATNYAYLGLWDLVDVVHRVVSLRDGLVPHSGGHKAESEKQRQSWGKSSAAAP